MKILIVSKYFEPQNTPRAFRTTELAFELSRQGHQVTVVLPEIENSQNPKNYPFRMFSMGKLSWREINLNSKGLFHFLKRGLRRVLKLLVEYPDLELFFRVKKVLKEEVGYDLLISIAVPHSIHWGAAAAQGKNHSVANTWVADCGDPFMGAENDTFKPPFYFSFLEKWFSRRADYITVPVYSAIPAYYPEFEHKIKVIPQGFRFEDIQGELVEAINEVPTFIYAGGLIPNHRDPRMFLDYLNTLSVEFKFILYTNSLSLISRMVEESKGKIEVRGYIPRMQLINEMKHADFLVNFENAGNLQIPSKLIDYAILDKPILSIDTTNPNYEIVNQFLKGNYQGGLVVENVNQYRIENVVKQIINLVTYSK